MERKQLGQNAVCVLVVIGFIVVLGFFIVRPVALTEQVLTLLNIMVGTLAAKFGDVVQFHIGSSAGSKNKDGVIETLSKPPGAP